MEILESIKNRWSPRAFSNRKITNDSINLLFEAARWAPSSMNEQPWIYYYTLKDDIDKFNMFLECLVPFNSRWAENAQLLILSVASKKFVYNNSLNRHALHDTGAANSLLAIQAAEMGLQVHQMGGFDMKKTLELFELDPENHEPATFIAVGFPGDPSTLSLELQEREKAARNRKTTDNFLFRI